MTEVLASSITRLCATNAFVASVFLSWISMFGDGNACEVVCSVLDRLDKGLPNAVRGLLLVVDFLEALSLQLLASSSRALPTSSAEGSESPPAECFLSTKKLLKRAINATGFSCGSITLSGRLDGVEAVATVIESDASISFGEVSIVGAVLLGFRVKNWDIPSMYFLYELDTSTGGIC